MKTKSLTAYCKLTFVFILLGFVSKAQIITTVAGTNDAGYLGDSLQGVVSEVNLPEGGMAMDAAGNVYFCDYQNNRVRKLDAATGTLVNVAGNGVNGFGGDGGPAKQAKLKGPMAVALDKAGNIYIADYGNRRIRKVSAATGNISTIAGTGNYGPYNGDGIAATLANLFETTGIAVDTAGNVYFSHLGDMRVRKIDKTSGFISTVAGTGTAGYNGDNIAANTAQLNFPYGLAFDKLNNLYVADKDNYRIRKISLATGSITTVAGNGTYGNGGDGNPATSANIKEAWDVDVDTSGNIYIADRFDNTIRKVDISSIIHTVAGTGTSGYSGDGGLATNAMLSACSGVVANDCGGFYINDRTNSRIRKVSSYNFSATSADAKCFAACDGTVQVTSTGGQAPYAYNWSGGLGSGSTYTTVCAGNYVVTSTDASGCKEQLYIVIAQPTQFSVSATTQTNVTCNTNGAGLAYTDGGAGGPNTYLWSGSTSTTAIGYNLAPGIHTVTISDVNNCVATATLNILFTPTLAVSVNVTHVTCGSLGSATVSPTGTGPYTYTWSTTANTNTISSLSAGNYSVTVTDGNGCMRTNTVLISTLSPTFASVPICFITVDSLSQHNVITWEKTLFASADSFFIYREVATNQYKKIQSQPYSAFSQFTDTVRTLYFPNTGDPNVGTYRYKLKTRNSCGEYSEFSPYHNTIYINNSNGTFSWPQLYEIEGAANPAIAYILERDNLSNGNWQAIGSVAGTQQFIIDPNYSSYQATASWRVRTQWNISCTPTLKSSSATSLSYSNRIKLNTVGLKENSIDTYLNIYPNPSNGVIMVSLKQSSLNGKNMSIDITTISGQVIYTYHGDSFEDLKIDLGEQASGIYFVKFKSDTQLSSGKIILLK